MAMKLETDDSSDRLRSSPASTPEERRHRQRRLCCCILLSILLLIIILGIVILVLFFTVLRPKDPTTTLVSARLTGVSPIVSFPVLRISLNITLDLDLLVYNPNRAAFDHDGGDTTITYRSTRVGDATIAPGRIPPHGSTNMRVNMTLEADRFTGEITGLLSDVAAGNMRIDTRTEISGRVTILGFIKHHAVSLSTCYVVIGIPDLRVRDQQCTQKTKL